jgi:hypothetical protein
MPSLLTFVCWPVGHHTLRRSLVSLPDQEDLVDGLASVSSLPRRLLRTSYFGAHIWASWASRSALFSASLVLLCRWQLFLLGQLHAGYADISIGIQQRFCAVYPVACGGCMWWLRCSQNKQRIWPAIVVKGNSLVALLMYLLLSSIVFHSMHSILWSYTVWSVNPVHAGHQ